MTGAVPQAAVDALVEHREVNMGPTRTRRCRCGQELPGLDDAFEWHVAAAVVAAVQGPIKAEALREAAGEFEEFAFVDDKRFKTVNTAAVRLNAARILRARADRVTA